MESVQKTDEQAAAVAKAPRVTLDDINNNVAMEYTFTASKAIAGCPGEDDADMKVLTICLMRMKNGFVVIGKSAPASPENFDANLGAKFAREDCVRQLWPIMGYALRETLLAAKSV